MPLNLVNRLVVSPASLMFTLKFCQTVMRPMAVAVTPKTIVQMSSLDMAVMECYFVGKLV